MGMSICLVGCVRMLGSAYRVFRGWTHDLRKIVNVEVGARPWELVVPKISPGKRHKRGFSGGYGCRSGVLCLVVGVVEWLGGAVRSGRSGLCALVCGVHGITHDPVEVFARVVGAVSGVA